MPVPCTTYCPDVSTQQREADGYRINQSVVDQELVLPESVAGLVVLQLLREGRLESKKVIAMR